ncbi:S-layer homology domain-containing protein [Lysinibacillus piscis]|uniref:S-layer homology domain-containing protein n=1 Tax=Lysinibacillus piscis TaxID=2518931 RepID=A0ABQ5NI16_9BACI|nr:S-layer homology domain-containing protein [Lysinibacillus sp. KH24]GLC88003.1 hypothetical protein LYSBPC_11300 [Lysinibacillus sp. KH24]
MQNTKQSKWKRSFSAIAATLLIVSSLSFVGTTQQVQAAPPTTPALTTSSNATIATVIETANSVMVDADVTLDATVLTGYENDVNGAIITIDNFQTGDKLEFTNANGITGTFDATRGELTLSGTTTIANYQTALRNVKFSTTATDWTPRTITFNLGKALPYNGHFYDYVNSNLNWSAAKTEAEGKTYFGRKGYLATITDADENSIVARRAGNRTWIGAQDIKRSPINIPLNPPGDWRWVTGPEGLVDGGKGLKFYDNYYHLSGSPVLGMYTNWKWSEPNNSSGGTEYLGFIDGTNGQWNDFNETGNGTVAGYAIEYGGMSGDATFTLSASKTIVFMDKTALNNKVKTVTGQMPSIPALQEADYTATTWGPYKTALDMAQLVLANPVATQQEINDALLALQTNEANLVLNVPTTGIFNLATRTVMIPFNYAITNVGKNGFTVKHNNLAIDLNDIVNITVGASSKQLELELASTLDLSSDSQITVEYTAPLLANLIGPHSKAVGNFTVVMENPFSLALQITKPTELLQQGTPRISTATPIFGGTVALNTTPDAMTVVLTDAENTPIQGQAMVNSVAGEWTFTPMNVLADGAYTLTVQAVNNSQTATKIKAFTVLVADKTLLQQKIAEERNFTASVYTPASWLTYQAKLAEAKNVMNNPDATQFVVNEALTQLTLAQNALVIAPVVYPDLGPTLPRPTLPSLLPPTQRIPIPIGVDDKNSAKNKLLELLRTKQTNGDITDTVSLTEERTREALVEANTSGINTIRMFLPDDKDEVTRATVDVPLPSLQLLRNNSTSLEIISNNAQVMIPSTSLNGMQQGFNFQLKPLRTTLEQQMIETRAQAFVHETLPTSTVSVVGRPVVIETTMSQNPVTVTLPMQSALLSNNGAECIFIEHSDGENKIVQPEVTTLGNGLVGLSFVVDKFSTFTIIQIQEEVKSEGVTQDTHTAYIKGFQDGTFAPEQNVTRAQIATMIARILGYTDGSMEDIAPFKDIASTHYAAGAIAFVKEQGIMNGDMNGNFRAEENITRAQMATVVANFKELYVEENVAITFNDTKGHWAQWIIEANRIAGIINGRQDGSFAPDAPLTRAQAVVMMNRMFERGPLQGVTVPSFVDVKTTHWAFKEIEEAASTHIYVVDTNGDEQLVK